MRLRWAPVFLAAAASGCALFTRGAPLDISYYDLGPPPGDAIADTAPAPTRTGCLLSLGRVTRADHLEERIAYRTSPNEVGFYETRRWTETPDNYLRRALERALFERGSCRRSVAADAPTLEVSLIHLEELRHPEGARVVAHVLLYDETAVLCAVTVESRRAAPGAPEHFDPVVDAMRAALDEVTRRIAQRVDAAMVAAAR